MSHDSRRILPSRKRKERETFHPSTSPKPLIPPTAVSLAVTNPNPYPNPTKTTSSNRLLAGYLAHEFLSKGTLLGQIYGSARAGEAEPSGKPKSKPGSYAEVANILKSDAAHVPGVVNPTQLATWIQM